MPFKFPWANAAGTAATTGSQMPTQQGVDRRRQIAEALMRVGQQGTGLSGPWGAVASALAGGISGWQQAKADQMQKGVDSDMARQMAEAMVKGGATPESAELFKTLPVEQQRQQYGQWVLGKVNPKPVEARYDTLSPGQKLFKNGAEVASVAAESKLPEGMRANPQTGEPEFIPGYVAGKKDIASAGAPRSSVSLNTDKALYGSLAEQQGKQYSTLYKQAQSAPQAIQGAQRVRELLGSEAITGAGANQKLAIARGLKALGLYDNEDIANTELLGGELARATLASIDSSGMVGVLTEKDIELLREASGGKITQDAKTLAKLADLNEKVARESALRWNETAKRLRPDQLESLGMQAIELPPTRQPQGAAVLPGQTVEQLIADPKYGKYFQTP